MTLQESYPFYYAYHKNPVNKLIHIVFVPVIFTTSIHLLSLYLPKLVIYLITASLARLYLSIDLFAASAFVPVLFILTQIGIHGIVSPALSLGWWIGGWIAQFVGHGVFEKRRPALMDNFSSATLIALFFVWLEIWFFFGYRAKLRDELREQSKRF